MPVASKTTNKKNKNTLFRFLMTLNELEQFSSRLNMTPFRRLHLENRWETGNGPHSFVERMYGRSLIMCQLNLTEQSKTNQRAA
jgi:hypothetical protein